ncbi:DNA polymerase catalytic subunit [Gallid alphaherpesvirus 1]|uniref:DNA polymerase n=1 Tax=Infectious laryngotracheitis virus TaxID=10386 RepID=S4UZJ2_ILTV|nr:DNA polymerase catalytic subunit [Gallid alphaherpesvirus 1]
MDTFSSAGTGAARVAPIIGLGPHSGASYYTSVREFPYVCPTCINGGGRIGTQIGRATSKPTFYHNERQLDILTSTHGAWPVRMKYWNAGPRMTHHNKGDVKFYEFHVYDLFENTEIAQSCVRWMHSRFLDTLKPTGTVITLVGNSACGKRVAVHVYGSLPYFFVKKREIDQAAKVTNSEELAHALALATRKTSLKNSPFLAVSAESFCIDVVRRRDIYYFESEEEDFYRVKVCNGKVMKFICDNFFPSVPKYESNVDAITRFILDNNLTSFGWYRFRAQGGALQIRDPGQHATSADVEINCTASNLELGNNASWPDYKLLCFDIECKAGGANEFAFPSAEKVEDLVIQISAVTYSLLTKEKEQEIIFSLGTCELSEDCSDGITVCECGSEFELLLCFMTFFKQYSPEFVSGYNILGFDWAYLSNKLSKVYGMRLDGYGKANSWGTFKLQDPSARGLGRFKKVKINGVVNIDMFTISYEKPKLPSYELNAVAECVLGEQKIDLAYKDIPVMFAAGPKERGKIGEYCLQDSRLSGSLFFKFSPHLEMSAVAKLACIPLTRAIGDGQQLRVYTCLLQRSTASGFVLPDKKSAFSFGSTLASDAPDAPATRNVGYQGAKVLDPEIGFHVTPVVVFDFASLYPSIIQSNNLCYSTLTHDPAALAGLQPEKDFFQIDVQGRKFYFVREHIRKSLLSDLLGDWLSMRKAVRAKIKTAETEEERILLDKQQAAIKVVCNSVYGFTGVMHGMLPCLEVASTVTAIGRDMLLRTKAHIEKEWRSGNQFAEKFLPGSERIQLNQYSVRVIYGDTDSVFVKFTGVDIETLTQVGGCMADEITQALFRAPVKLECEKIFVRLLLIAKKKYIGVMHGGKMLMKGVDLVRKTNCKFVNTTASRLVNLLFEDDEIAMAADTARAGFEDFDCLPSGLTKLGRLIAEARLAITGNGLNIRDFIMTAELSRAVDNYASLKLPHLTVYQKKAARREELPQIKERIEYVIIEPGQSVPNDPATESFPELKETSLISSLAEDPEWVVSNGLKLNVEYYFDSFIRTLSVTFNAIFGDAKTAEDVLRSFIPEKIQFSEKVAEALARNTATFVSIKK